MPIRKTLTQLLSAMKRQIPSVNVKCRICGKSVPKKQVENHMVRFHGNVAYAPKTGPPPNRRVNKDRTPVIVDGTNVAYHTGKPPKVSNIKRVRAALVKAGMAPIIYVSNALRYAIDDPPELIRLINIGWVMEADPDRDDDLAIIEEAIAKRARIVTNDKYLQHRSVYGPRYDFNNLIRFSIGERVLFYR